MSWCDCKGGPKVVDCSPFPGPLSALHRMTFPECKTYPFYKWQAAILKLFCFEGPSYLSTSKVLGQNVDRVRLPENLVAVLPLGGKLGPSVCSGAPKLVQMCQNASLKRLVKSPVLLSPVQLEPHKSEYSFQKCSFTKKYRASSATGEN